MCFSYFVEKISTNTILLTCFSTSLILTTNFLNYQSHVSPAVWLFIDLIFMYNSQITLLRAWVFSYLLSHTLQYSFSYFFRFVPVVNSLELVKIIIIDLLKKNLLWWPQLCIIYMWFGIYELIFTYQNYEETLSHIGQRSCEHSA